MLQRIDSTEERPQTECDSESHWDYVLVFENYNFDTSLQSKRKMTEHSKLLSKLQNQQSVNFSTVENILYKLQRAGLDIKLFYSANKDFIFCKVRASETRLKLQAAHIGLTLQLDPDKIRSTAKEGFAHLNIKPFPIVDVKKIYKYDPYAYIYHSFTLNPEMECFYLKKGSDTEDETFLFDSTTRKMLIENIITSDPSSGGAGCQLDILIYNGSIIECFPLHEDRERKKLQSHWMKWYMGPMKQPFAAIRDYFGVKIALYFIYLGHYTDWLLLPAVIGAIVAMLQYSPVREFTFPYLTPMYGAFINIWATVYLKNWKRTSAHAILKYGVIQYKEKDRRMRPEFKGEMIPSPIDTSTTKYFCRHKKFRRILFSYCIIAILILLVFSLVAFIFYIKYDFTKGSDSIYLVIGHFRLGSILAAVANFVQITIMTRIYNHISIRLNDQENHRTETEYENSLVLKTVIFQFVNNFSGLFYSAFLKNGMEGCEDLDCVRELQYILTIVYCSKICWGNVTEVLIPRFYAYIKKHQLRKRRKSRKDKSVEEIRYSRCETELFLAPYDWRGTFDDMLEMVLLFGYTIMFAAAFPIAPLLAYCNNYFEIRLDGYRLLYETRRPVPRHICDFGYWYTIQKSFSAIAIFSNVGIIVFTSNQFSEYSESVRVWIFTIMSILLFCIKFVLEMAIADIPSSVEAQLARQKFLIGKVFYHLPDHVDDVENWNPSEHPYPNFLKIHELDAL